MRILGLPIAVVLLAGCSGGTVQSKDGTAPNATSESSSAAPRFLDATPGSTSTAAAPDFEPLPGAKAYFGKIDRAAYRIEIPGHWNGDLVLWAHAVRGFGSEVATENPPPALRSILIDQGYAWGASSFSENGWAPGIGTNDTLRLKQYFAQQFGRPQRTYIAGNSMGGNIVTLSLERFPDEFDGGLAFCGAIAGEEEIDYLVAWAMAAEFIGGLELPIGQGEARVSQVLQSHILPALGPVEAPTIEGSAFRSVIRNLTGGPRPFFTEGYREHYAANFGLVTGDPDRILPMTRGSTNEGADYRADPGLGFDVDVLNQGIRRLPADPAVRDAETHPDTAPTTGQLRAPLLTLHETGDLTVPISAEQSYRKKVEATGNGALLVQRIIRAGGHCQFSDIEITQAWTDLAGWVADKKKPEGDDIFGDLTDAGRRFTNPLRANDPGNR